MNRDLEREVVRLWKDSEYKDNVSYLGLFRILAIHFANWQKEQMMKAAFDAEVGYWNIRGLSFNVRLKGDIKDGDRVKLIMIKEE